MGKKTKTTSKTNVYGIPLGFKHLGKPLGLAFAVYDAEPLQATFLKNSVDFDFEMIEEHPLLYPKWDENVKTVLSSYGKDKALGLVIISDGNKVISTETGDVLTGDTLPFKTGENRFWRNPKMGSLLAEDDDEPNVLARKEIADRYAVLFPNFGGVYMIEQVVDPAGISDSLDLLLHKQILGLIS